MKRLLVLISLLLLTAAPLQAQTETHTPTPEPTQTATIEATPEITPEVVPTPEIDDTAPTSPAIGIEELQAILNGLVAVLGILAAGIPLTLVGLAQLIKSINANPIVLRGLEIAYESASPTTQKIIAGGRVIGDEVTKVITAAGDLIDDIADGVPTK